jgi:hypothetical protein
MSPGAPRSGVSMSQAEDLPPAPRGANRNGMEQIPGKTKATTAPTVIAL